MRMLGVMGVGLGVGQILSHALLFGGVRVWIGLALIVGGFAAYMVERHAADQKTLADILRIIR